MIVTIFGATGTVGQQLVKLCLAKGYTVKAFGRNIEMYIDEDLRNDNLLAIKGYVFTESDVQKAVKGSNAVLSALGGSVDGVDRTRTLGMKNIITAMKNTGLTRIVAVGGMGVLDSADGKKLIDGESYPEEYKAVGLEHLQAFNYLNESGLDYTFVCPPNILPADANGLYQTAANSHIGGYEINAGNLALFMINELEKNEFVKQRVGISNI
jgi:uncharacterized protein